MTDNALESVLNRLIETKPPWYDENLNYKAVYGTFHWDLSKETIWEMFVDFYRYLEAKENEV